MIALYFVFHILRVWVECEISLILNCLLQVDQKVESSGLNFTKLDKQRKHKTCGQDFMISGFLSRFFFLDKHVHIMLTIKIKQKLFEKKNKMNKKTTTNKQILNECTPCLFTIRQEGMSFNKA